MSDAVRMLTKEGDAVFLAFLESLAESPGAPVPSELLSDSTASEPAMFEATVERQPDGKMFGDRHAFGKYLVQQFAKSKRNDISLQSRLWNWLSLYYFDQLCPAGSSGERRPLKDLSVYHLPDKFVWRRYYRHLVRAPWLAVGLHPESSRAILVPLRSDDVPLASRGEIFEQVAGRQELFRSATVMAVVHSLYYDTATGRPRAGSGGSAGGSPRRLGEILNQFALTQDLEWGDGALIVALLPKEFSKWRRPPET